MYNIFEFIYFYFYRVLPVFGTIPAMFGNAMATYVLTKLADWPIKPLAVKMREATYARLYKDYAGREQHVFNNKLVYKYLL